MTKSEVLNRIQNSASSIFTKEDVLALVNEVQEAPAVSIADQAEQIAATFFDNVLIDEWLEGCIESSSIYTDQSSEYVDYGSAEFELDHMNRVVLNFAEVNMDKVIETITNEAAEPVSKNRFVGLFRIFCLTTLGQKE